MTCIFKDLKSETTSTASTTSSTSTTIDCEQIISNYIPLVHYIVNKLFPQTHIDREDLISIGFIGLIKAVRQYKERFHAKVTVAWAYTSIKNKIIDFIHSEPFLYSIGTCSTPAPDVEKINTYGYGDIQDIVVEEITRLLTPVEKVIIYHQFEIQNIPRMTGDELADKLKYTRRGVCKAKARALSKLSKSAKLQEVMRCII